LLCNCAQKASIRQKTTKGEIEGVASFFALSVQTSTISKHYTKGAGVTRGDQRNLSKKDCKLLNRGKTKFLPLS
jgi:hypothetical protein